MRRSPLATLRTGLRGDTFREMHLHGLEIFLGLGVHGALEARRAAASSIMIDALRASATMIAALEMGMAASSRSPAPRNASARSPWASAADASCPTAGITTARSSSCATTTPARPWSSPRPTAPSACSARRGRQHRARRLDPQPARGRRRRRTARRKRGVPITLLMAGRNNQYAVEDALAAGESRAPCPKRGCTASCRRQRRSKPISAPAIQAAI